MTGSWSDFDTWIHDKAKSLIVQPPINHELLDSLNSAEKFWSTTTPWKMSIATVMNKAMEQFGFNVSLSLFFHLCIISMRTQFMCNNSLVI